MAVMKYIVVDLNIPFGLKVYGWDLNRSAVFFSVMSKAQWPCQLSGPPLEKGHFIYSSVHVSSCLVGMWKMKIFKQRAEGGGYVHNRGITTRQSLWDKGTPGMSEEQQVGQCG